MVKTGTKTKVLKPGTSQTSLVSVRFPCSPETTTKDTPAEEGGCALGRSIKIERRFASAPRAGKRSDPFKTFSDLMSDLQACLQLEQGFWPRDMGSGGWTDQFWVRQSPKPVQVPCSRLKICRNRSPSRSQQETGQLPIWLRSNPARNRQNSLKTVPFRNQSNPPKSPLKTGPTPVKSPYRQNPPHKKTVKFHRNFGPPRGPPFCSSLWLSFWEARWNAADMHPL